MIGRTKWLIAGAFVGVVMLPSAAVAEVDSGNCSGSIQFQGGTSADGPFVVDANQPSDEVVVIPRSDVVNWTASTPATSGPYSGAVQVDLPFPLGTIEIDSWTGEVQESTNSGTYDYDLPAFVPGGMEFVLTAQHTDAQGDCSGTLRLQLEGGPFASPITWAAIVITALLVVALGALGGLFGGTSTVVSSSATGAKS